MQPLVVTRHDQPRRALLSLAGDLPFVLVMRWALEKMRRHAMDEIEHEVAGYLLGLPLVDERNTVSVTYIEDVVRARYDSTPTSVVMHADSFIDVEHHRGDRLLVGWYHSHPRLGLFLSCTDVRNFALYYPEAYHIAVVVDPSLAENRSRLSGFGFFAWDPARRAQRVPDGNIFVVDKRPTLLDSPEARPATAPSGMRG